VSTIQDKFKIFGSFGMGDREVNGWINKCVTKKQKKKKKKRKNETQKKSWRRKHVKVHISNKS